MPPSNHWTSDDLRAWRTRLRWTQRQAADAICFHIEAYKKLEGGTRTIVPRLRRMAGLIEREHARVMFTTSQGPGVRQVFATAAAAAARMEALGREGRLHRGDGSRRVRYVSLCAGIESATAALERIGSDAIPVGFSEIDPAANSVLRHRWPDVPRLGDLVDTDWAALRGHVDLVVGGPPCQSFSIAGRRLGVSDPRGNLALHFLRAIGAMAPEFFLFENVPGLLSSNGGVDFDTFLQSVEDLGYSCGWRVLDARHFGVPQRRRRLWLIGRRGRSGDGLAEILNLAEGAEGCPLPGRAAWKAAANRASGRAGELEDSEVDWSAADAWLRKREESSKAVSTIDVTAIVGPITTFKANAGAGARGIGISSEEAPTLASASGGNRVPAMVYAADMRHATISDVASTIQVGPANGWSLNAGPCALQFSEGMQWIVRRFTPLECLRLQGLDDDWLDGVKLNGKPLSDGDKYRLIGNCWAVPCAAWLLERLLPYVGRHGLQAAAG